MSAKILQVNFKFNVTRDEYEQAVAPLADEFAEVRGCRWKIWLINDTEREAGGIYLFDDEASMRAMLDSELIAGVVSHPALSDFSVKQFDILEDVSRTTRAPIGGRVAQGVSV